MNALALGDDVATGLGVRTGILRLIAAFAAVLLCGAATALAGPIGFIGLLSTHVMRLILGPDLRFVIPMSAISGAIILTISDVVGRLIGSPGELEVGVVTAFIGAPILIILAMRSKVTFTMKNESIEFIMTGRRQRHRRWILVTSSLAVLSFILCCAMLLLGNTIYPVMDVIRALSGEQIQGASFAVNTIRLPRMLAGLFAGFAFGIAGNTFQTMLRNPLANPNVIGITSWLERGGCFLHCHTSY